MINEKEQRLGGYRRRKRRIKAEREGEVKDGE